MQACFQVLKPTARLSMAVMVFMLTIEISARVDDKFKYDAPLWQDYTADRLRAYDDEGIYHNVPNARFEKWAHNRLGFRGPEIPLHKPDGVTRIICMGTSETYGFYETPGKEWPAQLQEQLTEHPQWQVINTSIVGLGLRSYQPYMTKYVLPLQPDIVVLMLNPFHYVTGLERKSREQSAPPAQTDVKQAAHFSMKQFIGSSRSAPKIKQVVKQMIPAKLLKMYQIWDTRKQVQAAERLRLQGIPPKNRVPEGYAETFRQDLSTLLTFLRQHQIQVILTTYPALISPENLDPYYDLILDNRKFCVEFSFEGLIDAALQLNRVAADVAAEYQTGFVDAQQIVPKTTEYFADNVHYTDQGAHLIAEHIAEFILAHETHEITRKLQRIENKTNF